MIGRGHLEAYLEVIQHGSIQAAARATGRSRATYHRHLEDLRAAFDAPVLVRRAPGQRQAIVTPAGEELARRARVMIRRFDQWLATTRDAIGETEKSLRVGALAGSFDLIADLLGDLRRELPDLPLRVVEYSGDRIVDAVIAGEVDLGFGPLDPEGVPKNLRFVTLGPLPWAVIVPERERHSFRDPIELADLDGVPMVIHRAGPARERLERQFAAEAHALNAAYEVESTPRIVDMVERGFGPAIVSQFRLAFLPEGIAVLRLAGGPKPLTAGVFLRRGRRLAGPSKTLVDRAKERFAELTSARQKAT
jgi:DNA-binding transcriptional LysR family regulator